MTVRGVELALMIVDWLAAVPCILLGAGVLLVSVVFGYGVYMERGETGGFPTVFLTGLGLFVLGGLLGIAGYGMYKRAWWRWVLQAPGVMALWIVAGVMLAG